MGVLMNGWQGVGQAFAGGGSAEELAQRSLQWGSVGAGIASAAPLVQGVEQASFYRAQAGLADEGAVATRIAGSSAESALKSKFTQLGAEQTAAQAANGIEVNSKSAVAVRDATARTGQLDAAMLHYNAMREAFGLEQTAGLDRAAAKRSVIGGALGSAGTFLSSAASLSDKWLRYQQSGAIGGA